MFILNIDVTCILYGRRGKELPCKPCRDLVFVLSLSFLPLNCSFVALPEKDLSTRRVSCNANSPTSLRYVITCGSASQGKSLLAALQLVGFFTYSALLVALPAQTTACTPLTLIMPGHFTSSGNNNELLPSAHYLVGQVIHQKDFSTGETPAGLLANKGRFSQT